MTTTANPNPHGLQPRRYSGQTKVNVRERVDVISPRTSVYKRTYGSSSRNEVKKNSID